MFVQTRLLTVREVALTLRQSERTVRDKIASGDLSAVRIGSGPRAPLRVDAEELAALVYSDPKETTR
jgi:excisionase family DNA binding protein